jgi:hypothetical protein
MKKSPFVTVAFVMLVAVAGLVGSSVVASARTQTSSSGVRPIIAPNVHHDVSKPLRDMLPSNTPGHAHPALRVPNSSSQPTVHAGDTRSRASRNRLIPSPTANFDGISANGSAPPDTQGAAGTTQYFEMANSQIAVYSKTGSVILSPRGTNTLWSGFGGGCQTNNDGDGMIQWDMAAGRWVADQFSVSTTPYLMCLAISTTADATGTYNRYSFSYSNFPDYPKVGIWPDAYYTTINLFNAGGTQALGTEVCAYDRSKMLTGAAATQQCFMAYTSGEHTLLPASLDGTTQPTAGEPNYELGLSTTANTLSYFKFHVDWAIPGNSTLTGPTNLAVTAFSQACGGGTCIPQSGTTQQLDSLGDRVMARLAYRNLGGTESLVVTHSITAGSSVGARWYEFRVGGGNTLSVFQQGTYAPDSSYRWMGSIAEDHSGDMALGYSVSSSSLHPGIRYTGRLAGDPAGQMPQGEGTIITGAGSQTGGLSRWGDYSAMSIDPADDCTFWYTTEYIPSNGSFNWHTRIASFKFPSCGGPPPTNDFSISANPSSLTVTQGGNATSTISTTVTSGNSQSVTLSASGLPSGATAVFNPNPINSGSSSTLTITTAPSTPTGTYTVTVTGTGTDVTHTTTISLTVNPAGGGGGVTNGGFETGDFTGWTRVGSSSISTSSHSGTYAAVVGSTVPTNGDSSVAQTFTAPSGANTLTFWYKVVCPDTITYDWATATLKDNTTGQTTTPLPKTCTNNNTWKQVTAAIITAHSYTLTLISHDDNYAGDATYTYYDDVATATATNVVVNGGFETGTFSGWTTGGALAPAIVSSGAHSGTYAARLGSSSPYTGDSFAQQTVTVPGAGGMLTFWYQPHCTDTITYDQEQMQIRSTGGTVLATVLNVCSNSGAWTQVNYGMSAFAGQTVVLYFNNHDDGYPSDPTYTLVDDVSLQ